MSSRLADWAEVSAASMPAVGLSALAGLRNRSGITIERDGNDIWVSFPAGDAEVLRCLRPVIGIQFLARRGNDWWQFGHRLPRTTKSLRNARPLAKTILPRSFEASLPLDSPTAPVPIKIVRGGTVQRTTALRSDVETLARWANEATTAELAAVRGARCGRQAVLLGQRLPVLAGAQRYWGERVLVPLGFRPDPELSETVLRDACGATDDEFVVLDSDGADLIAEAAFEPLTRAGLRLAAR